MKLTVFSFAVNDKFPIKTQINQFKKNIKDNYEFILLNDANNNEMIDSINNIAKDMSVKCIRVPQDIHKYYNPSVAYAEALNWLVLTHIPINKDKYELILIVHSDVFPLIPLHVSNIIGSQTIASTMEVRNTGIDIVDYIYPAFTIINTKTIREPQLLDFNCGKVERTINGVKTYTGLDTGGMTYKYIDKYKSDIKFIPHYQIYGVVPDYGDKTVEYLKYDYKICKKNKLNSGWFAEGFYHYVAGSQWNISDIKLIKPSQLDKFTAASYIYKWYKYRVNLKRIMGNKRRHNLCVDFFN